MFSSFMHLNHQMNVPANDLFMRGIKIVQHPLITDPAKKLDHFNERVDKGTGDPIQIDHLILHCSFEEDIENILDKRGLSAHYVIHKDGTILQCVDESKRAYHAYPAFWGKVGGRENNINAHSIGIEIENPTFGSTTPYTDAAINSLIPLCRSIIARHHIPAHNVIGHSDVNPIGKADTGVLFPWRKLAQNGIGIYPEYTELPVIDSSTETNPRKLFESIGYKTETVIENEKDKTIELRDDGELVRRAFCRHFMPFKLQDERPTAEQIKEYRMKKPQKSTAEIMSDISLDFMKEYEKNVNANKSKSFPKLTLAEYKRLQVVEHAFRISREKSR